VAAHFAVPEKRSRGRPLTSIPILILDYGVALYTAHSNWATVLGRLEREGISYPRNTMIRRILRRKAELDVQNSDPSHY
jgi:hypothetical protein